jgi:hypothetical protein
MMERWYFVEIFITGKKPPWFSRGDKSQGQQLRCDSLG